MMSELDITDEHKQCVSVAMISVPAPQRGMEMAAKS